MQLILHYLKRYKKLFVLNIISVFGFALVELGIPTIVSEMIDNGIMHQDKQYLIRMGIVIAVISLIGVSGTILLGYCCAKISTSVTRDIREDVFQKVQTFSHNEMNQFGIASLITRTNNDAFQIMTFLNVILRTALLTPIMIIVSFTLTIRSSLNLSLIIASTVPVIILGVVIVGKISGPLSDRQQNSLDRILFDLQQEMVGELNGTITELYGGFNEILLFNRQKDSCNRFSAVNQKMADAAFKAQFLSSLISPFVSLVTYLTIGSIAVMGSFFVINGSVTVGNLQAFIRYIWQINDPLSQVSQLSSQVQSAYAAMNRIFTLLNETEEVQKGSVKIDVSQIQGNVTFDHVQFGYTDELLMKDVSFWVQSGQMVAIVGPTGAGKTTLMNLLLRFYDVNGGSIKIDGIDIRDMDRSDLRSLFSLVLQDTWLFSGSIFENIRYGSLTARKDEVVDAAKMANIHHYISTLSHGYDSMINEESNNISQGEKQLLTIARAILKNPRILILDEATSAVDTRLERMLQDAMQKVMAGRTSFVIAHRLSTIRNADLILVVDNGNIIEQGTHEELLRKNGTYQKLYHSQFANRETITAEE